MKQLSNLIFFYVLFTIPLTYAMLSQRRLYEVTYGVTSLFYTKYVDTQRYFQKKVNSDLTKAILGLEPNRQEDCKNQKVYLALKNYIKTYETPDRYPQGIPLEGSNNPSINTEDCRIGLSRGPLATNYLISLLSEQPNLDPYDKVRMTTRLVKNHGPSYLYGFYLIVLVGHNGEILMKKKFSDEIVPVIENTKLSLFCRLIKYLLEETNSINPDLLFGQPDKKRLAGLISDLVTIDGKLPK